VLLTLTEFVTPRFPLAVAFTQKACIEGIIFDPGGNPCPCPFT